MNKNKSAKFHTNRHADGVNNINGCKDDNLIVCRCMEIHENTIRDAIRQGAATVDAVKRATMAGMGLCQSKTCFNLIARIISEETNTPISNIKPMKIRIPVRPVKMHCLDLEK